MPFRFSLQPVLRFRASLERQHELLLEQANQKTAALRLEIEAVDRHSTESAARAQRELEAGSPAAELHFELLCRSSLLEYRRKLEAELTRCEELRQRRSLEYRQARQQREVIEQLRHERLKIYRLEEAHRQQQRLDEAFLARREFLRRD